MSTPSPSSLPPKVPTRSLTPVLLALLGGVAVIVVVVVKMTGSSAPEPAAEPSPAHAPAAASAAGAPAGAAAAGATASAAAAGSAAGSAAAPAPAALAAPAPGAEPPPPPPPPSAALGEPAPPPPPPPAEAASAGTAAAAPPTAVSPAAEPSAAKPAATVKAGAKRNTPCDDPCRGSATDELVRALSSKAAQARTCYERALSSNSGLSGKLEIALRVSPTGTVCSAQPSSDTLGDAEVASCVVSRFKSGTFPKPTGGCVDASVPISFKPAGIR